MFHMNRIINDEYYFLKLFNCVLKNEQNQFFYLKIISLWVIIYILFGIKYTIKQ